MIPRDYSACNTVLFPEFAIFTREKFNVVVKAFWNEDSCFGASTFANHISVLAFIIKVLALLETENSIAHNVNQRIENLSFLIIFLAEPRTIPATNWYRAHNHSLGSSDVVKSDPQRNSRFRPGQLDLQPV